jgi:CubicO group peptidase (beta-lactamase class C family)
MSPWRCLVRDCAVLLLASCVSSLSVDRQLDSRRAGSDQVCPDWFDDLAPRWLAASPQIPSIQLSIWSPECRNLHCNGVWNSQSENYTHHPPMLLDTPSRLASVTKPFTALAILTLVEDGVIDVNASVTEYLPDWAIATLEKSMGVVDAPLVTPWMLLHHTAGFGDPPDERWLLYIVANSHRSITHQETLEWFAENVPVAGKPGHGFVYSDLGYKYLGAILDHVGEQSSGCEKNMASIVRKVARLGPLGMTSTYWDVFEEHPEGVPPRSGQYSGDIDITDFHGSWLNYGGTGLVSSAKDLVKFARAFHEGELLGEEGMKMAYTTVPSDNPSEIGYGCGWTLDVLLGYENWSHRGAYGSWLYYFPDLSLAIAANTNQLIDEVVVRSNVAEILQHVVDDGICV